MAIDPALVGLRARTGAALRDCIEALRACDGDADRAASWLARAAVSTIVAAVGCPVEHAEAAHARFGWDVEHASIDARRTWFAADPAAEVASVRSWRTDTLRNARRFNDLLPIVYQANIWTSPLGSDIGELCDLECVLSEDRQWPEDWFGYSRNDHGMRDSLVALLVRYGAGALLAVLEQGKWDLGVDSAAGLAHLAALFARVKTDLGVVLEL